MEELSENGELALKLLLLTEGSGAIRIPEDATTLALSFEGVGFYDPMDYADETWRDLLATGDVGVISDLRLRQAISHYYNKIEALKIKEAEWDAQLRVYETSAWNVLPPLRRLSVFSAGLEEQYPILGGVEIDPPSDSDVLLILNGLRLRPDLRTLLSQVLMQLAVAGGYYRDIQSEAIELLRLVERARQ
jgi:hypothetical protein